MKKLSLSLGALSLSLFANPTCAHHPLGGKTPSIFFEGLISGFAHPVIGLDHFIFVAAMGIAAVLIGKRVAMPILFVLATLVGAGIHLSSINLPMAETMIALSVATIGWMILSGRQISVRIYTGLFAAAGLFHGFAYAEAIFGAETAPLVAYLFGFGIIQACVAMAAGYIVVDLIGKGVKAMDNMPARLSGGMVAGAGMLILGEQAIAGIFG
jgi:urease accessory protein